MPDSEPNKPSGEFVQSLARGLAVIRAFSDDRTMLTLADVAKIAGLSRASARRSLLTLETLGYVGMQQNRFYLRPRVLDLGYAFLSSSSSVDVTQDHLRKLSARLGESCSACEYDDGDIVYIARAAAESVMPMRVSIGRRIPAFCTSTGRVLLSAMPPEELDEFFRRYPREKFTPLTITDEDELRQRIDQVRAQGWAVNNQELDLGARSIAAPVVDARTGAYLSAVNVTVSTSRVSVEELIENCLPPLLETTARIGAEIALMDKQR